MYEAINNEMFEIVRILMNFRFRTTAQFRLNTGNNTIRRGGGTFTAGFGLVGCRSIYLKVAVIASLCSLIVCVIACIILVCMAVMAMVIIPRVTGCSRVICSPS